MPNKRLMRSFYPNVEELLTLDPFRGCTVVAGRRGLRCRVTGVNLSDTPSYYNWLSANEIIATTCYAIHENKEAIRDFVPTVYEKKLSGIFIKPKQYLGGTPQIMIEQAEELGIPLVELPDSVRLSDIVKAVFDEISRRETAFLQQSLAVNRMLIGTILGGADLDSIAGMLSEQVGASIMILDTVNRRRAVHIAAADRKAFSALAMEDIVLKLMSGAKEYPITVDGITFGNIYIYYTHTGISETNEQLLFQSISVIPLEISGHQSLNEMRKRDFSAYIFHLFSDPITDMKWEEARSCAFGIRPNDAHAVFRMRIRSRSTGPSGKKNGVFQKAQLISAMKYALGELDLGLHTLETDGEVIFILDVPADRKGTEKIAGRIRQKAAEICARYPQMKAVVGLGTVRVGIPSLIKSNQQACVCMKVAERIGRDVMSFDELGILRMIYSENPEYEIHDFIREALRGLAEPGRFRNRELLSTLECYLRNRGNVRQVSKALYTHYNTVSYRLKSIEEITGKNLNDPDDRFVLELATRLLRITADDRTSAT